MDVYLYRVGRNLNRAYRTCEAFGVSSLFLVDCDASLSGNLFKAKGRVTVTQALFPSPKSLLALETFYDNQLWDVDWSQVGQIILGGESTGLPRGLWAQQYATIPMQGIISVLTVEAALAITLYEWRRHATLNHA